MSRYNVLFLCTGNAGRSIIAEAILNHLAGDKFCAFSAGSSPRGAAHAAAERVLQSRGHAASYLRPKSWNEFAQPDTPPLHFVFTVCDNVRGEVCPVWPGQPITDHWSIPDPTVNASTEADIEAAFGGVYDLLHQKIDAFVLSMKMTSEA